MQKLTFVLGVVSIPGGEERELKGRKDIGNDESRQGE